ncbi:hypothetical protein H0K60_004495 [Salmonella enterica]|nr:hypothetical protein [Salmonella enterica]EFR2649737.1 hypothetical protein [Salmonella enterica]EFS1408086.1 hypothetical protein [Salmonella enterica]EHQ8162534.1 hypothetical protein [Salmonella enterica]EJZ9218187.1 hypothetical protein [Salmonella enterica]
MPFHIYRPHHHCHNTHKLYGLLKTLENSPDHMSRKACELVRYARAAVGSYRNSIVDMEMRELVAETGGVIERKREEFFYGDSDGAACIISIDRSGGKTIEQRHHDLMKNRQCCEAKLDEVDAAFLATIDAFEQQPDQDTFWAMAHAYKDFIYYTEVEAVSAVNFINDEMQLYFECEEQGIDPSIIAWVYANNEATDQNAPDGQI